ncbi:MAG: PepSY-associated TM helix domain-containing protein [Emticicia sp.]|nr:PepSY-associated TM helix domain-containing protein [Emticicia sp.]
MKLKGLPPRAYNVLFHTHTVSGIVISVALYIIFFAGAFTLFRGEFYQWENPSVRNIKPTEVNLAKTLATIEKNAPRIDWNEDLRLIMPTQEIPLIKVFGHLIPKGKAEEHFDLHINPTNYSIQKAETTVGDTLYRLHFLDQIPILGMYLAGFVALFFLFASITGVLIHWRNIFTKFWSFSLKNSWKQIWTNAHTVFGLLGLPFQMMYAVTGAFYVLLILILLPAVTFLYNGDTNKVYEIVRPSLALKYDEKSPKTDNLSNLKMIFEDSKNENPNLKVLYINTKHLQKADGTLEIAYKSEAPESFDNYGSVGYRLTENKKLFESIPHKNKPYIHQVINGIGQLHFATFGGILLKFLYFLMALFTCFVIVSGILLWREARNNKNYTDKQKLFHQRVTTIYLAICLGLFPAIPILFIAELGFPIGENHVFLVNSSFFLSWLLFIIWGIYLKTEQKMVKYYLLIAGLCSLLVPICNGIITHDWLWKALKNQHYHVLATDVFWLAVGLLSLLVYSRKPKKQSAAKKENEVFVEQMV